MSIECGIVAATRRASCSTKGMPAMIRGFSETLCESMCDDLRAPVRQLRYHTCEGRCSLEIGARRARLKCGFARICGCTGTQELPHPELHVSSRIVNELAIRPDRCRQSDDGGLRFGRGQRAEDGPQVIGSRSRVSR